MNNTMRAPLCACQLLLKSPLGLVHLDYSLGVVQHADNSPAESDQEQYFAYATALRTASGPAYQIGPCRSRPLIRSKPSSSLRGRIS